MGEVEAKKDRVKRHDFRHDRHTVSMLTDYLVFSPKYRGVVLLDEVEEAAEARRNVCNCRIVRGREL